VELRSDDFHDGAVIPGPIADPSVGGEGRSPHLAWSDVPTGTRSFAVTCWDPDAPTTVGFSHWVRFDLPPSVTSLAAGANESGPGVVGISDIGERRYMGMAPPAGDPAHRYIFTVYALDADSLGLGPNTTYALFRFAARNHILASATVTGRFAAPVT
jgi:Raf kinase inhibitor-like YbhB/YbcL family protein